jgi:hypothetical protein
MKKIFISAIAIVALASCQKKKQCDVLQARIDSALFTYNQSATDYALGRNNVTAEELARDAADLKWLRDEYETRCK